METDFAEIAQLVEHRSEKPGVVGSIPTLGTIAQRSKSPALMPGTSFVLTSENLSPLHSIGLGARCESLHHCRRWQPNIAHKMECSQQFDLDPCRIELEPAQTMAC
jgi:hypothetical protein